MDLNYTRVALATLGAFVAYFAVGTAIFVLVPQMINEGRKFPELFRSREGQMARMPAAMGAILISILILAVLYALGFQAGYGVAHGAKFGALIGAFVVSAFVVHNHVNFNIGLKLTLMNAAAYFAQWTIVGTVIGLIYKSSV